MCYSLYLQMFKDESVRIVAYTIEFYSLYPDVAFFFFFPVIELPRSVNLIIYQHFMIFREIFISKENWRRYYHYRTNRPLFGHLCPQNLKSRIVMGQ